MLGEISQGLPAHLTCDVHTFISGDRRHDDGLAMCAWEKVAKHTVDVRKSLKLDPPKIIMWSDGAPNQFKWTRPLRFISELQEKYGLAQVWWLFYASCHGKGMQDAAGAWVKTRVARAILLGASIRSVRDFFEFCMLYLITAAPSPHGTIHFTSNRFFYLLDDLEVASYRAKLPQVATWVGARKCHSFWATGAGAGHVGRRWLGCICDKCWSHKFNSCRHRASHTVDGVYYNQARIAEIVALYPDARTKKQQIDVATKVHMERMYVYVLCKIPRALLPLCLCASCACEADCVLRCSS